MTLGSNEINDNAQLDIMRDWFCSRFEDPVHSTPYDGEYVYIWGGPYNARDELEKEFCNVYADELIDTLSEELEYECSEWAPADPECRRQDYDDLLYEKFRVKDCYEVFFHAISNIESLSATDMEDDLKPLMRRMLFVNVISVLEVYLSDAFSEAVGKDRKLMRRYVETDSTFKEEKIQLSSIFTQIEVIEKRVKSQLINMIWHRLDRVQKMYENVLKVSFSDGLKEINQAITKRHDIVHRNGKDKDGNEIVISARDLEVLIQIVYKFAEGVDKKVHVVLNSTN